MRHVLFISYYFPPLGGVGPHRVLRLLPHLESLGWKPSVLTVATGLPGELRDESLLGKIPPGTTIYRTSRWDLQRPARWLRAIGLGRVAGPLDRLVDVAPPDRHLGWFPFAFQKAKEILKNRRIDALVSVSAPYTSHLLGWRLKQKFQKPWIVDLRDEWSDNPTRRPLFSWQARVDRWMEARVFAAADRILMTTPGYCHGVAARLPSAERWKVLLLTNGFDRRDFENSTPPPPSGERFDVVYSGSLYGPQNPSHFLKALVGAIAKGSIPRHRVRVTFIGRVSQAMERSELDPYVAQGLVRKIAFSSHDDAIRMLMQAHLLLLLIGKERGERNIPAKTFEYLAAGKPILALVPPSGDAARLLREAKAVRIVDPEDGPRIEQAIVDLYHRWAAGRLEAKREPEPVNRYESRALAERFVRYLDGLVARPPVPLEEPAAREEMAV